MNCTTQCHPLLKKLIPFITILGALNWGLIGVFNVNLVERLLGHYPVVVRALYLIVGISGVLALFCLFGGQCTRKQ